MGRWKTRYGNQFTTSGPYTARSEATQPVHKQFALFAVAHTQAECAFWECPGVLRPGLNTALILGGRQALGNLLSGNLNDPSPLCTGCFHRAQFWHDLSHANSKISKLPFLH